MQNHDFGINEAFAFHGISHMLFSNKLFFRVIAIKFSSEAQNYYSKIYHDVIPREYEAIGFIRLHGVANPLQKAFLHSII